VSVELRAPAGNEAEAIALLHIACWREAYAGIVPGEALAGVDPDERARKWRTSIADPDSLVRAAYEGAVPVGLVLAHPANDPRLTGCDGQIAALYVAASHYRLKLGSRLMAEAARWWLARGGRSLGLGVLAANTRAVAFYERLGGRVVATGTYHWGGADIPDVLYVFDDLAALAALR
jgi:ribosomal protein S18 acetylase RimI-like enzyme